MFDLAGSTAVSLLRKHGMSIRYPRLTPEQRAEIIELYLSGVRQREIARRFERDPGNIWHVLSELG
jgi:transposase-like protein